MKLALCTTKGVMRTQGHNEGSSKGGGMKLTEREDLWAVVLNLGR